MVNQGDIIILNFDPQSGHEQKGRRPALVVSNNKFQKYFSDNSIICPITSTIRNWKSHLIIPKGLKTKGSVMCEQLKFADLYSRKYRLVEKVPEDFLDEVLNVISMFF